MFQDVNSSDELKCQIEAMQKQIERNRIDIDEERRSIEKQYETKVNILLLMMMILHLFLQLADAAKQIEMLIESEASMKRKAQKASAEREDVEMHLQKLNDRNTELEKRQRLYVLFLFDLIRCISLL